MKQYFYVIVASLVFLQTQAEEFADYTHQCKTVEKQPLDTCLTQVFENMRPRLKTGIPELNVPVLEPMKLSQIAFERGADTTHLKVQFLDTVVRGLTGFKSQYVRIDPINNTIKMGMNIPKLLVKGDYILDGQFFLLNLNSNGVYYSVLSDVRATGTGKISQDRAKFFISDVNVQFEIGHLQTKLEGLFADRPNSDFFAAFVDDFISTNSQEIIQDITPEVTRQLNALVEAVMNDAFSVLPKESFFSDYSRVV